MEGPTTYIVADVRESADIIVIVKDSKTLKENSKTNAMKSQTALSNTSAKEQRAHIIEDFAAIINEHPEDISLSLKANSVWSGNGRTSNAEIGPWSLTETGSDSVTRLEFRNWKELEKATPGMVIGDRIRPIEASLAALCASVNWSVCINSALDGITFEGLEIQINAIVNPELLLGQYTDDDLAESTISVEIDIHVNGNNARNQLDEIRKMAQRAPFMAMVMNDVRILTTVH